MPDMGNPWVAGDFGDHAKRDGLDRLAAIAAMGALAVGMGIGRHGIEIDADDGIYGVNQRHRIGPVLLGGTGRLAHIGDVGGELDDHRHAAVFLAPAGDHADIFRHLADRRPHAALGHAVGTAEIQLDAVAAGILD